MADYAPGYRARPRTKSALELEGIRANGRRTGRALDSLAALEKVRRKKRHAGKVNQRRDAAAASRGRWR